jgi:hypothetical protein
MAEPKIRRRFRAVNITLASSVADTQTLRWDEVAGGALRIDAGSTNTQFSTTIQLWASGAVEGTFGRLYKSDGSASDLTIVRDSVNATTYSLPDECYGVGALKLVTGSTHLTSGVVMLKT